MPTELTGFSEVLMTYANRLVEALPLVGIAIVVFGLFWFGSSFARNIVVSASENVIDDKSIKSLFGTITRVVVVFVGFVISASIVFPGLETGDLVGVLGLTTVAIGFAFKDIFKNFLSGVLILIQRPFLVDDQIVVVDYDGYEGTVEAINIRSTILKTYDSKRVVIPNSQVYDSPVVVKTAYDKRRSSFETGIGYDEDIEEGREVILEALAECEWIDEEPEPQVFVSGHGDSSVDFDVRYWTKSRKGDVTRAKNEVATKVRYALDEADIEIPYPYRSVEFFDMTEEPEQEAA